VTPLRAFESCGAKCALRNDEDAALHRHLHELTSAARTMIETSLARLMEQGGLVI
jgi:hypothetical protein